jgi:DnaJ-class molecular chaperone
MGRMSDMAIEAMETPIMAPCPDCHGDGYIVFNVPKRQDFNRDVGYLEQVREVCESCSGDGEMERLCDCGEVVTVGMGEDAEKCEECAESA